MKTFLLLFVAMLISACSTLRPVTSPPQTEGKGEVKIIAARNWNYYGSGVRNYLTFDGDDIVGMYTREYTEFITHEGLHKIGVRYGSSLFGWEHAEKQLILKSGVIRYFLISPTLWGTIEIEEIDENEALERTSTYRFAPPGTVSNFHFY